MAPTNPILAAPLSGHSDTPEPGRRPYPPTTPETVKAVVSTFNETVAHLRDSEANSPPPFTDLFKALPQGPIKAERKLTDDSEVAAISVKGRNHRDMANGGLLMLRTFTLFKGFPFIDRDRGDSAVGREMHYIKVFESGILWHRVMVGAEPNETVSLLADHHDLRPQSLGIALDRQVATRGRQVAIRGRREAIQEALKRYDANAAKWGLTSLLSRGDYEAMLLGSCRIFDRLHGHHLLRSVGTSAG